MITGPSSDEVARTVYAKGFPKTAVVTEDMVKRIFEPVGRIRNIKLRKDEKTGMFRGSVYVEFEKETSAIRAVANPPLQPGAREPLAVMLRREYERRAQEYEAAGKGQDRHKDRGRERGHPSGHPSSLKHSKMGSGDPSWDVATAVTSPAAARGHGGEPVENWQQVAEEREKKLKSLEEGVKSFKENALKAQEDMDECLKREQMAAQKLLTKESEVDTLQEEVTALRTQMHSKLDAMKEAHVRRIDDLEARMEQNKNEIILLKHRNEEHAREREWKAAPSEDSDPPTPPIQVNDPLAGDL